jgi:hypothetical protein
MADYNSIQFKICLIRFDPPFPIFPRSIALKFLCLQTKVAKHFAQIFPYTMT